jgi:O-antigen ligase
MLLIKDIKNTILHPSQELQLKYTLWMNHLLVIYTFFVPISTHARAQMQFLIIILFFLRSNYKLYLSDAIKNPIIISFIIYFFMYIIWLIGTENFHYANNLIDQNKYTLFFPLLIFSFIDKRFTKSIVSALLLGILFSEITSYLISLNIIPWRFDLFGEELYQAQSPHDPAPFLDHAKYGLLLAVGVGILIYRLFTQKYTLINKILTILFITTVTINLSITGGRIGYVIYVVLIFSFIIFHYKTKLMKPLLIASIFIGFIGFSAYSFSSLFKTRIDYSLNTISNLNKDSDNFSSSLGERLGLWYYSVDIVKDNFLFGVGTGDGIDVIHSVIQRT